MSNPENTQEPLLANEPAVEPAAAEAPAQGPDDSNGDH